MDAPILGPGEAKHDIERRLRDEGLGRAIVGVARRPVRRVSKARLAR